MEPKWKEHRRKRAAAGRTKHVTIDTSAPRCIRCRVRHVDRPDAVCPWCVTELASPVYASGFRLTDRPRPNPLGLPEMASRTARALRHTTPMGSVA